MVRIDHQGVYSWTSIPLSWEISKSRCQTQSSQAKPSRASSSRAGPNRAGSSQAEPRQAASPKPNQATPPSETTAVSPGAQGNVRAPKPGLSAESIERSHEVEAEGDAEGRSGAGEGDAEAEALTVVGNVSEGSAGSCVTVAAGGVEPPVSGAASGGAIPAEGAEPSAEAVPIVEAMPDEGAEPSMEAAPSGVTSESSAAYAMLLEQLGESSSSEVSDNCDSETEFEIVGVVPAPRCDPDEDGALTRSQSKNLRTMGVRRVPDSENSGALKSKKSAPKPDASLHEVYRVVDRRETEWGTEYHVLWANCTGGWESKDRLLEDGLYQHLEIVDRWKNYATKTERRNAAVGDRERESVMNFKDFFNTDIGALRLMGDNERHDCMFQAIRHIFEEGFDWMMCFSDDDVGAYREENGIDDRDVTWKEFMGFLRQVVRRVEKKKRESLDFKELERNLFRGQGVKLKGLINLDLSDGWYLCGAIDFSRVSYSFPLWIQNGLWRVIDDGEVRGLGTQTWIFRMSFVRRLVKKTLSDVEVEPGSAVGVEKERGVRRKRGSKAKKQCGVAESVDLLVQLTHRKYTFC